jgi:hypothetical protein
MQQAWENLSDQGVGKFVDALMAGQISMQTFLDIGKAMVADLLKSFMKLAIMNPLKNMLFGTNDKEFGLSVNGNSGVGGLLGNMFSGGAVAAKGMASTPGGFRFALGGGITRGPTMFQTPRGPVLGGEAGPEAIMPLTRTSGGKLGVAAAGMGGGGGNNVSVQIINQSGARIEQRTQQGPNGDLVKVLVREVLLDDMHNNGPIARGQQQVYGTRRIGSRR